MSEWWSYSLSDFLLFSPRVYYRLIELHNHALFPAHIPTVAIGLSMIVALAWPSPGRNRPTVAVLGVVWIWIAWAYFWERYATINWASAYVAPAFVLQGLLLISAGLSGKWLSFDPSARLTRTAAMVLLVSANLGYPLIAPAMGRSWSAAEVFGIVPDPTALATLALLAAARGRARWLLVIMPLLWVAISTATLRAMIAPDVWLMPLLALAALAIALLPRR